jgi:hypothetical protein
MRVRRSSDNTEADIGFDGNGELDETALAAHVGANSGYVKTWYDQSGNARDITQTTNGLQPRIVNAGTIEKINGKCAVKFLLGSTTYLDGATNGLLPAAFPGASAGATIGFAPTAAQTQFILYSVNATSDSWHKFSTVNGYDLNFVTTRHDWQVSALPTTGVHVFHLSKSTTLFKWYLDGIVTAAEGDTQAIATTKIRLGAGQSALGNFDGHITEFVIHNASLSPTDRDLMTQSFGTRIGATLATEAPVVSGAAVANALFQRNVEGTLKLIEALRVLLAVSAGDANALTTSPSFMSIDRLTARLTEAVNGQARTKVTLDGTQAGDAFTAPDTTADAIVDDLMNYVVEGTVTLRGLLRIILSERTGSAVDLSSAPKYKSLDGAKNRIEASIAKNSRIVTSRDITD